MRKEAPETTTISTSTTTQMQESNMNVTDFNAFSTLPLRFSKHQGVFGKYAACDAGIQNGWPQDDSNTVFVPHTPFTPSLQGPPGSVDLMKSELLTPDSLRTVTPDELLSADNSPLFDEIDAGEMQNWESLFLDEEVQTGSETQQSRQQTSSPAESTRQSLPEQLEAPRQASPAFDFNESLDFSVLGSKESSGEIHHQLSPSPQMSASKASSPNGGVSKKSNSKKLDDLGITVYKRKPRSMPLKPVEVPTDGDDLAAKRAKNTEAARRSRARKLERMSQLEDRVRELLDENEQLKAEVARLRCTSN